MFDEGNSDGRAPIRTALNDHRFSQPGWRHHCLRGPLATFHAPPMHAATHHSSLSGGCSSQLSWRSTRQGARSELHQIGPHDCPLKHELVHIKIPPTLDAGDQHRRPVDRAGAVVNDSSCSSAAGRIWVHRDACLLCGLTVSFTVSRQSGWLARGSDEVLGLLDAWCVHERERKRVSHLCIHRAPGRSYKQIESHTTPKPTKTKIVGDALGAFWGLCLVPSVVHHISLRFAS